MGGGAFTSTASMNQLGGSWDVETHDENTFVLSSSSCSTCTIVGRTTLTFSRVD